MLVHDRLPNFLPWRVRARANARGRIAVAGIDDPGRLCSQNLSFYFSNDLFRFIIPSMDHQPARTLWNPASKENDDEAQHCADSKCASPPQPDWNIARIEKHKRSRCAHRRADPV